MRFLRLKQDRRVVQMGGLEEEDTDYGKRGGIQGQILPHVESFLYGGLDFSRRKLVGKKDTDPAYVS